MAVDFALPGYLASSLGSARCWLLLSRPPFLAIMGASMTGMTSMTF